MAGGDAHESPSGDEVQLLGGGVGGTEPGQAGRTASAGAFSATTGAALLNVVRSCGIAASAAQGPVSHPEGRAD
jgi:hypothetical protein